MWSPQQEIAIQRVSAWLKSKSKPFFSLGGWAGTGKSTLAKHLAEGIDGRVYYGCYTGKAANVLRQKGIPSVSTIHKLIYKPKDKNQQLLRELRAELTQLRTHDPLPTTMIAKCEGRIRIEEENLSRPMFALNDESPLTGADLLVIDEFSMVDGTMGSDLLSFGCPILFLGDPGQLPPVRGNSFIQGEPDYMLTEIHRQAADNPIIWMSKEVREGRALKPGKYGESEVCSYASVPREEIAARILASDQLLVGRNATRISSNNRIRQLKGRTSDLPEGGDKLVCLRNNNDLGLFNGQIWTARTDAVFDGQYVILDLKDDEDTRVEVVAHADYFHGNKPEPWGKKDAEEFDYGEALTVHKYQGSQANNIVLLDEWFSENRRQWLYTGLTRAAEKINVFQM